MSDPVCRGAAPPSPRPLRPHRPPLHLCEPPPPKSAVVFAETALRQVIEVIDRRRPVAQLRPLMTPVLVDRVIAHAGVARRGSATMRRVRVRQAPWTSGSARRRGLRGGGVRVVHRGPGACTPSPPASSGTGTAGGWSRCRSANERARYRQRGTCIRRGREVLALLADAGRHSSSTVGDRRGVPAALARPLSSARRSRRGSAGCRRRGRPTRENEVIEFERTPERGSLHRRRPVGGRIGATNSPTSDGTRSARRGTYRKR